MRNKDIESWSRIETVGELIEELKKYPPGARVKDISRKMEFEIG